mmetsp:Transcript_38086/g.120006  ORF Transcript_38086/g.120006 Transcript_38086/m.120006 type:complete len:81 (-) Transcript_38086:47-289(-)
MTLNLPTRGNGITTEISRNDKMKGEECQDVSLTDLCANRKSSESRTTEESRFRHEEARSNTEQADGRRGGSDRTITKKTE